MGKPFDTNNFIFSNDNNNLYPIGEIYRNEVKMPLRNLHPRLTFAEAIDEVKNRTGIPREIVESILWTYNDIVKECMLNQIEVSFGDIGLFTIQFFIRREKVKRRNPYTGETIYKDFPAHYRMNFRQALKWRKTMREETAKLFEENRKDYEQ